MLGKMSASFRAVQAVTTELFTLGEISFAPAASAALKEAARSEPELVSLHQSGAWMHQPHLQIENLAALKNSGWVCSSFELTTGKTVWLMTTPDRSSTIAVLEEP